jgi:hypothetical protein
MRDLLPWLSIVGLVFCTGYAGRTLIELKRIDNRLRRWTRLHDSLVALGVEPVIAIILACHDVYGNATFPRKGADATDQAVPLRAGGFDCHP